MCGEVKIQRATLVYLYVIAVSVCFSNFREARRRPINLERGACSPKSSVKKANEVNLLPLMLR
jgi:hypothetical protein